MTFQRSKPKYRAGNDGTRSPTTRQNDAGNKRAPRNERHKSAVTRTDADGYRNTPLRESAAGGGKPAAPRRGTYNRSGNSDNQRQPAARGGAYNRTGGKYPPSKTYDKRDPHVPGGSVGKDYAAAEDSAVSARYSNLLISAVRQAFPTVRGLAAASGANAEPLAFLEYERELELKNLALRQFWKNQGLPDKPNLILPSPRPRHYRTTTKRRVIFEKGKFALDFPANHADGAASARLGPVSALEPVEHAAIYAFLLDKLNQPAYSGLGHALNYLVIRGDYTRFTVIFNAHNLNANVARKANLLAEHLRGLPTVVVSAFLFFDPSKSPFYLDQKAPEGPWKLKNLFGPDTVRLQMPKRSYTYPATGFCQVNASILPAMLEKAEQLLKARPEQRLLDLFCGFGFFSLYLADAYSETIGVDASSESIRAAQGMAGHKSRFHSGRITVGSLERLLPQAGRIPEAILLDPPRQGVEPGVIKSLAARNPARVLHIFCDMDTLPREINIWRKCGYMVSKVVPLDMFPGTDNLEVMVLFLPDQYGILNRVDKSIEAKPFVGGRRAAKPFVEAKLKVFSTAKRTDARERKFPRRIKK